MLCRGLLINTIYIYSLVYCLFLGYKTYTKYTVLCRGLLINTMCVNGRFPEITGEDNLTVFSYSGRVKSPECRRQRRRADLQHFEICRHGPMIIYTRLPAGATYYPICMFPTNSECLIGISDAFSAFCLRVFATDLAHVLTVPPTKACLLCATPLGTLQVHARRQLPSAVTWISEDRLFF